MTDSVLYEVDERGVARITLNRPALHNAFDDSVIRALTDIFTQLEKNTEARVVVIGGAGKSFSAGADLNWMRKVAGHSMEENKRDAVGLANMFAQLNFLATPTIAGINGAAFGGGVGLVACCDIAIASNNAKFALSEVKLGLAPAVISPYVIRAIGYRQARRYFLSGETFMADTAMRIGLVHQAVDPSELDKTIDAQIDLLLDAGPQAVTRCKQLVFENYGFTRESLRRHIEDNAELIAKLRDSDEGREGLMAFLEKRDPSWRN